MSKKLTFNQTIILEFINFDSLIDPNLALSSLVNKNHSFSEKERSKFAVQPFQTDQRLLQQVKHSKKGCIIYISDFEV